VIGMMTSVTMKTTRRLAAAIGVLACRLALAQDANPVTNGGFEALDAAGFPAHWNPVGQGVTVVSEARSGSRAVQMVRTAAAVDAKRETGLNRAWRPHSGEQGAMLSQARGGIRFWYRVPMAAEDAVLRMNVIAMDGSPVEGCNVPRAFCQVPRSHMGDGQWHEDVRVPGRGLPGAVPGEERGRPSAGRGIDLALGAHRTAHHGRGGRTACSGVGPGHLRRRRLVGVVPGLGRITASGGPSVGMRLVAREARRLERGPAIGAADGGGLRMVVDPACLRAAGYDGDALTVDVVAGRDVADGSAAAKTISVRVFGTVSATGMLLTLDGPRLTTWTGGKDEALVPGMEWLVGDEDSSSDNVIAHDHPHRLRWRQHPHLVTVPMMCVKRGDVLTGLFWHPRARWTDSTDPWPLPPAYAQTDRPTPVFAAPDRFSGHACASMGLSVPTVTTYGYANASASEFVWPPVGGRITTVDLTYAFYVDTGADSALDGLRDWFALYGVTPPRPLPQMPQDDRVLPPSGEFRGPGLPAWARSAATDGAYPEPSRSQWVAELEWSMQAYLETLWDADLKAWRVFHGGPPVKHRTGAFANYLYDCVTTARLAAAPDVRERLDARVKEVVTVHGGPVPSADDMGFRYGDPVQQIRGLGSRTAGTLKSQDADGGWRFRTRVEQDGVFKGRDYAGLAYDGFEANGLAARKTWELLRAYRLTGEERLLKAGLKGLRYMEKFRVPRAAQVWEVIAHAPDILAAADACQAYIEGYKATGEPRWLEQARYWGWAGLPFVYAWGVDAYPWMRYASIPIFGSTWWTCTWFGRPVQWNGLRYAYAIMELAELDDSFPWMTVARGITTSALYQQGFDPDNTENYALWPDVYNAVDGSRVEWNFAPRGVILPIHKLMGLEPVPRTLVVDSGDPAIPIRVHGCVSFTGGRYAADTRTAVVSFRDGAPLNGRLVVSGVTEPRSVSAGAALRRVDGELRDVVFPVGTHPKWRGRPTSSRRCRLLVFYHGIPRAARETHNKKQD